MADEIEISVSLDYEGPAGSEVAISKLKLLIDQTGSEALASNVQALTSTPEALQLGDIAAGACGWTYLENLSTSETIEYRARTGEDAAIELKPGEPALFRMHSDSTPFVQTTTNPASLRIVILGY